MNSSIATGRQIRRLRSIREMSLVDLQEKTGINYSWLSRIETGKVIPTADELARIREALAWTPALDELLEALAAEPAG